MQQVSQVYMLYLKQSKTFAEMVFTTREAIERYIDLFGNPTWEIVPTVTWDVERVERIERP